MRQQPPPPGTGDRSRGYCAQCRAYFVEWSFREHQRVAHPAAYARGQLLLAQARGAGEEKEKTK